MVVASQSNTISATYNIECRFGVKQPTTIGFSLDQYHSKREKYCTKSDLSLFVKPSISLENYSIKNRVTSKLYKFVTAHNRQCSQNGPLLDSPPRHTQQQQNKTNKQNWLNILLWTSPLLQTCPSLKKNQKQNKTKQYKTTINIGNNVNTQSLFKYH